MSQWDRPGFQCGFNSTIGLKSAIAKHGLERYLYCTTCTVARSCMYTTGNCISWKLARWCCLVCAWQGRQHGDFGRLEKRARVLSFGIFSFSSSEKVHCSLRSQARSRRQTINWPTLPHHTTNESLIDSLIEHILLKKSKGPWLKLSICLSLKTYTYYRSYKRQSNFSLGYA